MTVRLVVCSVLCAAAVSAGAQRVEQIPCAETPMVRETPPPDPNADAFGEGPWHVNADRTLWMYNWSFANQGVPEWRRGLNHKVMWIRPAGANLIVTGERIDAPADPLSAKITCCYPTGFQVGQVTFPAAGCWRVSVTAGDHHLEFVTRVHER